MPLRPRLRALLTEITLTVDPGQVPAAVRADARTRWAADMMDEFPRLVSCAVHYLTGGANQAFVTLSGERSGETPDADKENPIALRAFEIFDAAVAFYRAGGGA